MAKRKAGAFAMRVGAGIRRGLTFKQAVQAAKGSNSMGKVKSASVRPSGRRIMARRRIRRFRRRGTVRVSRKRGWTPIRIIKVGIATAPVGLFAYNSYKAAGGGSAGATQVGRTIVSAYTGYDIQNNTFAPQSLTLGYIPIAGAWLFGKIASRVLR